MRERERARSARQPVSPARAPPLRRSPPCRRGRAWRRRPRPSRTRRHGGQRPRAQQRGRITARARDVGALGQSRGEMGKARHHGFRRHLEQLRARHRACETGRGARRVGTRVSDARVPTSGMRARPRRAQARALLTSGALQTIMGTSTAVRSAAGGARAPQWRPRRAAASRVPSAPRAGSRCHPSKCAEARDRRLGVHFPRRAVRVAAAASDGHACPPPAARGRPRAHRPAAAAAARARVAASRGRPPARGGARRLSTHARG